ATHHDGDAIRGPELVGPAMLLGSLGQQRLELGELVLGEPGRGAGMGLGPQAALDAGQAPPTVDGGLVNPQDAGHEGRGLALFDECDGASSAALEFVRTTDGSAHVLLYACSE